MLMIFDDLFARVKSDRQFAGPRAHNGRAKAEINSHNALAFTRRATQTDRQTDRLTDGYTGTEARIEREAHTNADHYQPDGVR